MCPLVILSNMCIIPIMFLSSQKQNLKLNEWLSSKPCKDVALAKADSKVVEDNKAERNQNTSSVIL